MASRKRRKRRPARRAWLPDLDLPVLEQRHWDLIGLGMVAFAAFFACVFYLDWAGGEVGEALAGAILFMFGGVGYASPVLLFAAGAMIVVAADGAGAPSAEDRRGVPHLPRSCSASRPARSGSARATRTATASSTRTT